jgi:hypothetical protein
MIIKPERSSIEVTLSKKIEVHKKGESLFSNKITLIAPSLSNIDKICFLKHTILSAFKKAGSENNDRKQNVTSEDASDISNADQLVSVLYMSIESTDIAHVFSEFRDLLIDGCGKVEDVVVTNPVLNQLCLEDFEKLLGEYLENFLLPSWMRAAMKR